MRDRTDKRFVVGYSKRSALARHAASRPIQSD
jgi:hypothetical protein